MSSGRRNGLGLRIYAALCLLPAVLTWAILWVLPSTEDAALHRARAMRGFANIWAAGRAATTHNGGVLFDTAHYARWVRTLFGQAMVEQMWGYPPTALLVAVPLSWLPLMAAFVVWTLAGLAAFNASLRMAGLTGVAAGAVMVSPAVLDSALAGQSGALTAALLVGGLSCSGTTPVLGGILLGLLTIKPQLGLLVPLCLLARMHLRAACWAAASALVLALLSALCFGQSMWVGFATSTTGFMSAVLAAPWVGAPWQLDFVSPFMALRALGMTRQACWVLQGACTLGCALLAWRTWRGGATTTWAIAVVAPLAILATPYAHDYDLPATAYTSAVLACAGLRGGWLRGERAAAAMGWAWPGLCLLLPTLVPAMSACSGLVSCAMLAALAWCAHRRACMQERAQDGAASQDTVQSDDTRTASNAVGP